ncbi:MAG TPA: hypothetical protein VH678_05470 [Xanthobacteraceae bacterium]|jgi:hypothetical protein
MHSDLDLDLIFPIRDVPSAELMRVKAACLRNAGVIDAHQKKIVDQRAQEFLKRKLGREGNEGCTRLGAAFVLPRKRHRRGLRSAA